LQAIVDGNRMFKIATWNVNSLNVRLPHVIAWLQENQPDVLALQEIKCVNENFPYEDLRECGYHALVAGQKTYNGVAILSKKNAVDDSIVLNFPHFPDEQRRILGVKIHDIFVLNVYVPNGAAVGTDKYAYKLAWLQHLHDFAKNCPHQKIVILGDFNIAPADEDVYEPLLWKDQLLVSEPERAAWRALLDLGFVDSYRRAPQGDTHYSWWDYRQAAFRRDMGLRIDHILANSAMVPHLQGCGIDKIPRGWERPSDHAPVMASFLL
jgi:exodeoxyribonuclease-3